MIMSLQQVCVGDGHLILGVFLIPLSTAVLTKMAPKKAKGN